MLGLELLIRTSLHISTSSNAHLSREPSEGVHITVSNRPPAPNAHPPSTSLDLKRSDRKRPSADPRPQRSGEGVRRWVQDQKNRGSNRTRDNPDEYPIGFGKGSVGLAGHTAAFGRAKKGVRELARDTRGRHSFPRLRHGELETGSKTTMFRTTNSARAFAPNPTAAGSGVPSRRRLGREVSRNNQRTLSGSAQSKKRPFLWEGI